MFRSLDAGRIAETAERLGKRITERFPGSGLSGVAESLRAEVDAAAETARWLARPQAVSPSRLSLPCSWFPRFTKHFTAAVNRYRNEAD